jgi:NADPH:quinone reductase
MRSMVMRSLGEPDQLELAELPERAPGPGEVGIDVDAIGCNFADVLICRGKYQVKPELPFAPGSEVVGRVRAADPASGLQAGQAVTAQLTYGAYASYVVADVRRVQRVPAGVPPQDAVALGVAYQTAYLALVDRARLANGEWVLVHAAAGGVGLATVQIAHALGARVIATASGADKLALCREHGADAALDTNDESWPQQVLELTSGRGADVISESIGGDVFERSLKCIAWAGRLLVIGFSSGEIPALRMNRVMLKHIDVLGLNLHGYHERDPAALARAVDGIFELYAQRKLAPLIHARYPLAQASAALAELASRRSVGKLILDP